MSRLAVLSYHTSPLAQPGTGDGGGMNVYVRELSSALARRGHDVDVYTRRTDPHDDARVSVEPGFVVHHVPAGPPAPLSRDELPEHVAEFSDAVKELIREGARPDVLHAHYWLSGLAGHRLKHDLGLPLVLTFHTLERVKADAFRPESDDRAFQEAAMVACADALLASCDVEGEHFTEYYDAAPERVHVVPPGVAHAFFSPGDRVRARTALGYSAERPFLLYVGRLQELKGVDLALEAFIALRQRGRDGHLAIVGGPSGPDGAQTLARLHRRVEEAGVVDDVAFVAPQTHVLLSTWMRAADVTLVPSRSESFGLVALESMACGTPVVASDVGGLSRLVDSGATGYLLGERDPGQWADVVERVLDPSAAGLASAAARLAREYTWARAARSLEAITDELTRSALVSAE